MILTDNKGFSHPVLAHNLLPADFPPETQML